LHEKPFALLIVIPCAAGGFGLLCRHVGVLSKSGSNFERITPSPGKGRLACFGGEK
jgi:hypothetical protein